MSCLSKSLELHWRKIHDEYKAQTHEQLEVPRESQTLSPSFAYHTGSWKYQSIFKEVDGQCGTFDAAHTAAQQCSDATYPGTCAALREAISCYASSDRKLALLDARFSVLEPGSHIQPHCGRTNARLVAHLGLSIPFLWKDPKQPAATIRVGCCETRSFEEGKVVNFRASIDANSGNTGKIRLVVPVVIQFLI